MRWIIILIVVAGLGVGGYFLLRSDVGKETVNSVNQAADIVTGGQSLAMKNAADRTAAIAKAQELLRARIIVDEDLSSGPCLSDSVIPDWVADIAHNPRQAVDDMPENQCAAFRSGQAHHFVELDVSGNLIKAE